MTDRDTKTDQAAPAADEKRNSPSAGLFGFAGPTRFHPGQMPARRDSSASPIKPETPDGTGGHSTAE